MSTAATIDAMRTAAYALRGGQTREALRAVQAAQDALDAAKAHLLGKLEESKDYELDGASSVTNWARRELRLEPAQTRTAVRCAKTMRDLPEVEEAAATGSVRMEHLNLFAYGVKHIGHDIIKESTDWLLRVAKTCEPSKLRAVMKELRQAVYPDSLDEAWIRGMDREDLKISPVPDGWHVSGFLNQATGAKLKAVLDALTKPSSIDDVRTSAQRRVDALDDLVTSVLDNGLPSDKGIRPHILVNVDVETLHNALTSQSNTGGKPAELVGFGPIGSQLLNYLGCAGDITPILTSGKDLPQAKILNVGRDHRLATPRQRKAITARQHGRCAAPGCTNTHLEIHHTTWWSNGGKTNLDEMAGYCSRCHHLIHRGLLDVAPSHAHDTLLAA
ncbi:MAG: DUF222 domain-containing protein [Aeromicrobium sp.]|uniref:HNH endonuclease n=1 Tax=Aeromicrobium sp. TaxID=1871063 RepID=UPI0039E5D63C